MAEALWALLLLLPVAAASGWYIRDRRGDETRAQEAPAKAHYLRGINHLVNDESDRAIEAFVRVLDVDDETVDTHLALGNLFRRHGEVDRALRVHQNLVARPTLSQTHRNEARFELARDYQRAGVLDRAEDMFRQLVDRNVFLDRSMTGLISIYEQERDWSRAIEITRRLEAARGYSMRPVIAQYYCELAEEAGEQGNLDDKRQHLKRARSSYNDCVRATLLRGQVAEQDGEPRQAIRIYRQVLKQDVGFASEIIAPVRRCFASLGDWQGYSEFLGSVMKVTDAVHSHIAFATLLDEQNRTDEAIAHLSQYLLEEANWIGFHKLLALSRERTQAGLTGPLDSLCQSLDRLIASQPDYRCNHCGFSGQYLHWQCPSCRQWNTMAPVHDIQPTSPV